MIHANSTDNLRRIESDAQSMGMTKEEIDKWDMLMVCTDRVSLEDLYDNISITEKRIGISDRMSPDYWRYVARYVLSLYDDKSIDDRYERLRKFEDNYENDKKIKSMKNTEEQEYKSSRSSKPIDTSSKKFGPPGRNTPAYDWFEQNDAPALDKYKPKGSFEDGLNEHGFEDFVKTNGRLIEETVLYDKAITADDVSRSYYMNTVPDSHFFSELEQIRESLRYLKIGYLVAPVPRDGNMHVNWPPISIEHMEKGIDNTIKNGYVMVPKSKEEEHAVAVEELKQVNEWMDDLNVPKKELGHGGNEYSVMGRVMQLLQMIQSNFQDIQNSGLI